MEQPRGCGMTVLKWGYGNFSFFAQGSLWQIWKEFYLSLDREMVVRLSRI